VVRLTAQALALTNNRDAWNKVKGMSAEQAKKEYVDTFFEVSTGACYPHYDACSMYSRSLQVFEPLKGMSI